MKKSKYYAWGTIGCLALTAIFSSCKDEKKEKPVEEKEEIAKELAFQARKVADSVDLLWAKCAADVTGDGIADLIVINHNDIGGYLGYYKGQTEAGVWELHKIAETAPTGGKFASGDLEAADIDGDGDIDVLGVKHPGEWTDAGHDAELFWYENTDGDWKPHTIGIVPDAVKDVNFTDFDNDGTMDISVLTFDEQTLSIFRQESADKWKRVQYIQKEGLHEGMDVGDLDGDGFTDIVATGFAFYNPGEDLEKPWKVENIDSRWNTQTGDWSRNGTKAFLRDLDDDDKVEVFISHSERAGYPIMLYSKKGDSWESTVVADSITACHTLQVYDFDLDDDYDVLNAVNGARANDIFEENKNLTQKNTNITVQLNGGDNETWTPKVLSEDGMYNGFAIDYDSDGDIDYFRYPDHMATEVFLEENTIR